ncbi:hypothetical protein DD238_001298 [Peronospora effusa]|uniref:Uncharacterized protein n=1 Tax=Peronospora effusa TaxID=542832 RepID=A0A3M6VN41_9STRA|nr:hypothetical protein DD238_001298 [Peronospora effusa]
MATIPAVRSRRRRDRSFGQIPLSSSEIELYSRQDEVTRRRRRLLAVRDEERRLAQQMTLRYRNNLQKLQYKKLHTFQEELSIEQQKMLNELYAHYQKSRQSTGTEQRNACLKLREFMEQAQKEKNKWTFDCKIGRKERTIEAHKAQEKEAAVVTAARRRQVEQRRERLKVVNNQQGRRTIAGFRQENDVDRERVEGREELETLRKIQSSEEVVVTPRPHQKDKMSYRTDCGSMTTSRPVATMLQHDRRHSAAMRGKDEEMKYTDEIDHERKQEQLIVEAQQKKGLERGRKALNEVVLRRQGLQAMEWLALVDKMERRARGQDLGGGEDYLLHAGDVYGGMDKSERIAERAFAQMLGLDDDSVELSVFSINSDDTRSVTSADPDHELVNGDEAAFADSGYRAKLRGTKCSGSFDLYDRSESIGPVTRCQDEHAEHRHGEPLKTTTLGNLQREQLEKLKKAEDMHTTGLRLEEAKVPSKACSEVRDSEYEDKLNMSSKLRDACHEKTCSYESHSSTVAVDEEDKDSNSKAWLQDLGDGPPNSNFSAGRLSGAPSEVSSTENVQSKNHSKNECSEAISVERDDSLRSVFHSENGMESVELNTGQLGHNCGVVDCALLETPYSQREWCTATSDQFISGTSGHQDKYGNAEEQSESTNKVEEHCSASHRLYASPQSLAMDEVNEEKVLEVARKLSKQVFATGSVDASLVEGAKILSASSSPTSDAGNHEYYDKSRVFDSTAIGDDERLSLSDSFSTSSQKSLSQLDQVGNDRIRSLKQLSIDQQMLAFSDLEGFKEDEGEANSHRPSFGTNSSRSSVNFSFRDLYNQRRSSTSAVSVAQYSLPISNTQHSFDESVDRLYLEHDDSFVNELVPIFPKHTLPPPPRSLEEDNQALEEYDIQLIAPNMSRMLTSEQLSFFRSSQQPLNHQATATDQLRRQPPANTTMQTEENRPSTPSDKIALSSSSSSWRSYSDSSSGEPDATSLNTSVEQSPLQQHEATGQIRQLTTVAAGPKSRQHPGISQPSTDDWKERDALSAISSESGFSSLGFTVQLDVAAGPTWKLDTGDDGRVIPSSVDSQHNRHAQEYPSDDEVDKQSIASERSFASSSSMSLDAYFDYLINLTSTVRESLPLQLQLPAMMYGKKDMTKPPTPITWSTSSASSVTTASKVDQSDDSETSSLSVRRSIANSDSLLNHPPRPGKIDHLGHDRSLPISYQSDESDARQVSEHTRGSGKVARSTFTDNKRETTELRLSSLSSSNMSQPPTPMQNLSWSSDDYGSFDGQSTDDSQLHHVLPPPLGYIDTHQPAAAIQRFGQSLDDFQSSSEQNFRDRSFQRRGVQRRFHHHSYDANEESKQDDSSSESSVSSHRNASWSSSTASSRRQSIRRERGGSRL